MAVSLRQVERGDANAIAAVDVSAWRAGYRAVVSGESLETINVENRGSAAGRCTRGCEPGFPL
ncbi:MAG: hypothetical protein ACP5H2_11785, partial [Solirubrobacteraceae bacterium]